MGHRRINLHLLVLVLVVLFLILIIQKYRNLKDYTEPVIMKKDFIVDKERAEVFQNIYHKRVWTSLGNGSGPGSTKQYTHELRRNLFSFISSHRLNSMADMPCGAMVWTEIFLKHVWKFNPNFKYIGMDITESVVKNLQEKWKHNNKVSIKWVDMASSIPNINVDFILIRDAFQHMPLKDVCLAIANLINLGNNIKYMFIGTYRSHNENRNIPLGKYYSINIMEEPFNFPKPYLIIDEKKDALQKYVFVFKPNDIQKHKCRICSKYIKRKDCRIM